MCCQYDLQNEVRGHISALEIGHGNCFRWMQFSGPTAD